MQLLVWPIVAATLSPVVEQLQALGYENLRLNEASASITVWYENRRRPTQLEAIAEVLTVIVPLTGNNVLVRLVPCMDDQPLLTLVAASSEIAAAVTRRGPLKAQVEPPIAPPSPDTPVSPTWNHVDLTIQPAQRFSQQSYDLLARLELAAPVRAGLRITGRLQAAFLPRQNLEPPRGTLRSVGWLAPGVPAVFNVSLVAGGLQTGGEIGYELARGLGFLKLRGGLAQNRFSELIIKAESHLPWWDCVLSAGWGTYALGDWGPFATFSRTYSRSRIDIGAFRTHYGTQFRATLAIDWGPNPRSQPATLRLIPGGFYQTSYLATAYLAAQTLDPPPDIDGFLDRFTPAYLEVHLDRLPWPK
ncbi:MAG: hypothetical protein HY692_05055 [Cyanobacteria bacterium NC_groundwater_1444_Ag_S-0.65um_54_12]|nr:hypothetical protein [Cyanobacteria bacterium NC_groundwater_1444_Ag_S-0.65um_54_12]